ncbi:murein tripeptide amidase MpaA [Arenicella xantha]|uniref:Murein tripeptide amidase MpaA n=1 Tax=Arenicella xantha TaxID=644221 RepID=A0A395JNZ8_9GAMM|nr:M14-type cytosolic carboxypeptidase [Arenicella xantha]RBP51308.1 murein tripeptide amidase MpaA [Arenicella xantha]
MSVIQISDQFDSGSIDVIDATDANNIQLAIRKDNAADFLQWFHFRIDGEVGQVCKIHITNTGESSYVGGWPEYDVCTSWNRQDWFRTPCTYADGVLSFEIELHQNSVYFAYFAPYSYERHLDLLAWAQSDERVGNQTLGSTLDGRSMSLLRISDCATPKRKVWVIARQHPGETMAEWFVEGFLHALLDVDNPLANKLLQDTAFYVVPNMNPDGSARGNLRTNAAGANLNREWESPSMTSSPEVFLVRERMLKEGGDLFLDIHGDEELPYNFVAGCEGNLGYDARHAALESTFKNAYMAISPDFQDTHGYPKDEPGKADMRIAANWLGEQFKTLSFTIEMPFKDNADLPNPYTGWSPERSAQLGRDVLFPVNAVLASL